MRVVLKGLVALVQSGVNVLDRLRSVPTKVAVGFLQKLLGVLESSDRMVDFRMSLGAAARTLCVGDDSSRAQQHGAGSNDGDNAVSSQNQSPYLSAQHAKIQPD